MTEFLTALQLVLANMLGVDSRLAIHTAKLNWREL
jgi:hypothetical protein